MYVRSYMYFNNNSGRISQGSYWGLTREYPEHLLT